MSRFNKNLPTKLNKEPLIDAVFEIRFSGEGLASNILPGYFYSKLIGEKKIERLPTADLPKPIIDADQNLMFAPLYKVYWDKFVIMGGDRTLAIGCVLPYPGWQSFKKVILEFIRHLHESKIVRNVQRFSLKYMDIVEPTDTVTNMQAINAKIVLGSEEINKQNFSLRVEILKNEVINVVQIISHAVVTDSNGRVANGLVLDIDSIINVSVDMDDEWINSLSASLDNLHQINKEMFFDFLSDEAIATLEPVYEQV